MKFIATSALTYLAYASAEEANEDLAPRRFNSIVSMAYSQVTTAYSRGDFEDRISKYGCHCFPGDSKAAGGQGPAVDALDASCKKLSKCHKCILLELGENSIDVNDGRYSWEQANDGSIDCSNNAEGSPRRALCECDAQFANEMESLWDDSVHNEFYWKNNRHARQNPTFDETAFCVPPGNGNGQADACCGLGFPAMEPYNSAQKSCCALSGVVFNTVTHDCCVDGSISSIGGC